MTACTRKEEVEWRVRLGPPRSEGLDAKDASLFSSLDLDIKSLGTLFGKPGGGVCTNMPLGMSANVSWTIGTIARRVSIHRATTVGPKSPLCQMVLKNTSVVRESASMVASSSLAINRSQSLLTTNARIPVLAPARSERARLEALLAEVWSREVLPFPGMTARARSEHLVRTSASTVMRKLSVASIASSFTKKTGSVSQRAKQVEDTGKAGAGRRRGWMSSTDDASSDHMETDTLRRPKKARTGQGLGAAVAGQTSGTRTASAATETGTVRRGKEARAMTEVGESISLRAWWAGGKEGLGQDAATDSGTLQTAEKENGYEYIEVSGTTTSRRRKGRAEGLGHGFMSLFR